MSVATQYQHVAAELAQACRQFGRDPAQVRLIAVSKTVGLAEVGDALAAGAGDFGENRPDELVRKANGYPQATWHFIGNIQSRRIPDIVAHASLVHSLYQARHAEKINAQAEKLGKVQDVLLEVNVSGEESKSGVSPAQAPELLQACLMLPNVRVRGLMTMAPQGSPAVAREVFEGLACLHAQLKGELEPQVAAQFDELSMGMSQDWREAVAAGATMVRIGRAVFSDAFCE